jgi:hypothetical protein
MKNPAASVHTRGTAFPTELPVGLTTMFATDQAKIRGWQAFWRKTGPKAATPPLEAVIQLLVIFWSRRWPLRQREKYCQQLGNQTTGSTADGRDLVLVE